MDVIKYSTQGLTVPQRRILGTLPEAERPEYTRQCRLENAATNDDNDEGNDK